MNRYSKRGFTIIELVIVIAVVAILASVLIPVFSDVINGAYETVDEQLVDNLNKILTMHEALEGKNQYMHAAILDLEANGISIDSLKLQKEGNTLLWDQDLDRFVIGEKGTYKYSYVYSDKTTAQNYYYDWYGTGEKSYHLGYTMSIYWTIYTSADYIDGKLPNATKQQTSIYWGEDVAPEFDTNGEFIVGFDSGHFDGTISTEMHAKGKGTFIRGNFTSLKIENSNISHFGKIGTLKIHIPLVNDPEPFYEYGYVESVVAVQSGGISPNLVAKKGSQFKQAKTEIETIVFGASHLIDEGAEFGVSL